MVDLVATLGGLVLDGFEIPEEINGLGGEQSLKVKKLVGGSRVISGLGRDDDDPVFSGRFRGFDAESRMKQFDAMRVAGLPVLFTFSTFIYSVIIQKFKPRYLSFQEIPYTITLCVLADLTTPILPIVPSLDSDIGDDLSNALGIADSLNIPAISAPITALQADVMSVQTFTTASPSDIASAVNFVAQAQIAVGSVIATSNAAVAANGNVAGVVAGADPAIIATTLLAQSGAFSNLGNLYPLQSSLGRMGVNLNNAGD